MVMTDITTRLNDMVNILYILVWFKKKNLRQMFVICSFIEDKYCTPLCKYEVMKTACSI